MIRAIDRAEAWGRLILDKCCGIGSTKMSVNGRSRNLVFQGRMPWKDEQEGKSILQHQIFQAKH